MGEVSGWWRVACAAIVQAGDGRKTARSAPLGFFFNANKKVFSDGSGTISWGLMEEAAEPMGKGREKGRQG